MSYLPQNKHYSSCLYKMFPSWQPQITEVSHIKHCKHIRQRFTQHDTSAHNQTCEVTKSNTAFLYSIIKTCRNTGVQGRTEGITNPVSLCFCY